MNQVQDITKHVRGKHPNFAQRAIIQVRLQDGWSSYRIAKELGCCANTIRNEIKRGTPSLYWGNTPKCDAVHAHAIYDGHRMNSHRTPNIQAVNRFLKAVEACFKDERWSLDACVGYFRAAHEFAAKEMVCTKTLYNYVDRGILKIKNVDLPQKLRRKPRKDTPTVRTNKKKYGRSIEERPTCVASRELFGDWELDLVIGSSSEKDHVLMTLLERKTRYYKVIRPPDKTSQSVMNAFAALKSEYGKRFSTVFKTITIDNGSEFSQLAELELESETKVYYAHPYSSYEKGSNERHNGLLCTLFTLRRHFEQKSLVRHNF